MRPARDGLRAWKQTDAGARTYSLYDGSDPVAELDANGSIQALNTFGANGLVSRHTTATNASVFYTFDERGNVDQRLDSSGVLSIDLYDAFGARTGPAPASDPWGFGAQWGYQTDNETGLVLCTNRYYDPQQGRFVTRDPMGYGGGTNLYSYTANNPVNEVDPLGFAGKRLSNKECEDKKAGMAELIRELKQRFQEMLDDYQGLYEKKDYPPPGDMVHGTSWTSHQNKYDQVQDELRDALNNFMHGCGDRFPKPSDAKSWANMPAPIEPYRFSDHRLHDDGFWVSWVLVPPIWKAETILVDGLSALGKACTPRWLPLPAH